MPNGKPDDHPVANMLLYGKHPFPPDIEWMLRKLIEVDRSAIEGIALNEFVDWEEGRRLYEGRKKLHGLLEQRGINSAKLRPGSRFDSPHLSDRYRLPRRAA